MCPNQLRNPEIETKGAWNWIAEIEMGTQHDAKWWGNAGCVTQRERESGKLNWAEKGEKSSDECLREKVKVVKKKKKS